MARPKLQIDPSEVERLAEINATDREIAFVLNCSTDTLSRRFHAVIERGRARARISVRRKQYELALAGNTQLLIFLGKNYLQQSEKVTNTTDCDGFVFVDDDGNES